MTTKKAAPKKKSTKKKAPSKTTAKKQAPSVQILQTSKCSTVSGRGTLTYNLGTDHDGAFYVRISNSTGGGFFSKEWVALSGIQAVLEKIPDGAAITSPYLSPVFVGKSSNNAGYLLAVLLAEAVLAPFEDKKRHYVYRSFQKLLVKVSKKKAA